MTKHKFIVLEGIDCCGKTTLTKAIADKLGRVTIFRFPDRSTPIGDLLNKYLQKDSETVNSIDPYQLHLLFSANRYERASAILAALNHGHVICDRYWMSGAIYSTAKGLNFEWCASVDKHLPQPDHWFFIDVNETIVSQRKGFGLEEHDHIDFQHKVYNLYKAKADLINMEIIPGIRTIEEIVDDIISRIN